MKLDRDTHGDLAIQKYWWYNGLRCMEIGKGLHGTSKELQDKEASKCNQATEGGLHT